MAEGECGSTTCLVDRLEETVNRLEVAMKAEAAQSRAFIERIFQVSMDDVKRRLDEQKESVNLQWEIVRDVQKSITIMQTEVGPGGLEKKIKEVFKEDADFKSIKRNMGFVCGLGKAIAYVTILGALAYGVKVIVILIQRGIAPTP